MISGYTAGATMISGYTAGANEERKREEYINGQVLFLDNDSAPPNHNTKAAQYVTQQHGARRRTFAGTCRSCTKIRGLAGMLGRGSVPTPSLL